MHHLLLTRKAALTITSAVKYFYNQRHKSGQASLFKIKKQLSNNLADFKAERMEL